MTPEREICQQSSELTSSTGYEIRCGRMTAMQPVPVEVGSATQVMDPPEEVKAVAMKLYNEKGPRSFKKGDVDWLNSDFAARFNPTTTIAKPEDCWKMWEYYRIERH